jgi:hypothetical protein
MEIEEINSVAATPATKRRPQPVTNKAAKIRKFNQQQTEIAFCNIESVLNNI